MLTNVILYQDDELTKKEKKQQAKDGVKDKPSKKEKKGKDEDKVQNVRMSIL